MILLGKSIKELREKHNLTQAKFAERIGVAKVTVASYECNSRQPSYEVLVRIARTFNMSTDAILMGETEETLDIRGLSEEQTDILKSLITYFRNNTEKI